MLVGGTGKRGRPPGLVTPRGAGQPHLLSSSTGHILRLQTTTQSRAWSQPSLPCDVAHDVLGLISPAGLQVNTKSTISTES